jgi:hypothetical protein
MIPGDWKGESYCDALRLPITHDGRPHVLLLCSAEKLAEVLAGFGGYANGYKPATVVQVLRALRFYMQKEART